MRRLTPCLLVVALVALPTLPLDGTQGGGGKQYAFLVACGEYDQVVDFPKLPYTVKEMAEFRGVLLASGFAADNIKFLHDQAERRYQPEKARIEKELDLLLSRLEADDTVVVVFNGHGLQYKGDKTGYFCPLDAEVNKRKTLVAMEGVFAQLTKCAARRKLLIVNACRNHPDKEPVQATKKAQLVDAYEDVPKGIAALYACQPGQFSYFYPKTEKRERSLFMHHLIEAWQGKYTAGGPVTLAALFKQVRSKTAADADRLYTKKQIPHPKLDIEGDWEIAKARPETFAPVSFKLPSGVRDLVFVADGARFVVATRGLLPEEAIKENLTAVKPYLTVFDTKTHHQLTRYQMPVALI